LKQSGIVAGLAALLWAGSLPLGGGPLPDGGSVYAQTATNAVVVGSVSFRTQPSVEKGERIRYLRVGERVLVTQKLNAYWYAVTDGGGKTGYVSANAGYLRVDGPIAPAAPAQPQLPRLQLIEQAIAAGYRYLGTPYEYGSDRSDTSTFDCSDFVRQAFLDGAALKLPADSRAQGDYVRSKGAAVYRLADLKRGDLVFFMSYRGSRASDYAGVDKSAQRINHVAIYLGDGKLLHTYSRASGGVRVNDIGGNAWEYRMLFGGSVWGR